MERITIELPIVRIEANSPLFSSDFAKEHYEEGVFIVDDGVMRHLMIYDGTYVNAMPCPHEVIEKYLVEKAIRDNDEIYHRDMEAIEDRLSQIARLLDDVKVDAMKSEDRLTATIVEQSARQITEFNILSDKGDAVKNDIEEMRDDLIDTIDERFSNLPKSDNGANVLDVARAFAVISKPELIKELSK